MTKASFASSTKYLLFGLWILSFQCSLDPGGRNIEIIEKVPNICNVCKEIDFCDLANPFSTHLCTLPSTHPWVVPRLDKANGWSYSRALVSDQGKWALPTQARHRLRVGCELEIGAPRSVPKSAGALVRCSILPGGHAWNRPAHGWLAAVRGDRERLCG